MKSIFNNHDHLNLDSIPLISITFKYLALSNELHMSLADVYLFSRAPREMARFYMGSLIILFIFIFLFDDFISALLYYLVFLIFSIPFVYLIGKVVVKKQQNEDVQTIESNVVLDKIVSKEQVDKYLDKTKCMSCMSPVEEDAEFCPNCGFKLIK